MCEVLMLRDAADVLPGELVDRGHPALVELTLDGVAAFEGCFLSEPGGSRTHDLRIKSSITAYTQSTFEVV